MKEPESEKLLEASSTSTPAKGIDWLTFLKYGSLCFLILQNSSHVLMLRYSRVTPEPCGEYVTSVAVLCAELLKLAVCLIALIVAERGPLSALAKLDECIWQRKFDTLKVAIPSFCYTLQNNLQFVAASHLGAALLQLLYQTKTLSTAIFGVVILQKSLRCNQWCALSVLVCGVVLAQGSQSSGGGLTKGNALVGVTAAIGVSVCSGFASVYLEKILKGDTTPLLVRNVQLCIFSIPLQLLAVYQRDYDKVLARGWLHGFCVSTWLVVGQFAFGGLLVAVVIRFADNNLKNLAMAVAIILSCMVSIPLFGFQPNMVFGFGGLLVIISIFLYAWDPKPKNYALITPSDSTTK
jgi:UDP-galactose transporter